MYLIEKYLKGQCSGKEYEEAISCIQDPAHDLLLTGALKEAWKKTPGKTTGIRPNEKLLDSIHHQIALKEQQRQSRKIRLYKQILGVAAVLIMGLVIHSVFIQQPPEPEVATHNISVPYGGKTNITLPDGSEVWINSGSQFHYPGRFDEERVVELEGEAYFDVVPGEKPFIVKSPYGDVKVMGTKFNVKAYDEGLFATTLVSGSVIFTSTDGKRAMLTPGTQVILEDEGYKLRQVETALLTSWKEGRLIFREESLQKIVTRLERWYNVDIELKGERIKNLKYTGTIEMETFSEVLELIKVTTPITYSFDKDTRVLTIASP